MLLSVPMVGIYMPLYDHMHMQLRPDLGAYAPAIAGMGARAVAALATAPLELARTRQQAGASSAWPSTAIEAYQQLRGGGEGSYRSSLRSIISAFPWGFSRMWAGAGVTLARDVPFTALYWCALEPLRSWLLSSSLTQRRHPWEVDETSSKLQHPSSTSEAVSTEMEAPQGMASYTKRHESPSTTNVLWANLIAGSISGALAAAATTPLDVLKTRIQTKTMGSEAALSSTPESARHVCKNKIVRGSVLGPHVLPKSANPGSQSAIGLLWDIYRLEGVRGLFTGVVPRVARAAPACAIVIATYEVLKTAL